MNKHYVRMVITPVGLKLQNSVLTGSLTTTKINVNTVEVEEFEAGFGTGSDITAGRDFMDISFD